MKKSKAQSAKAKFDYISRLDKYKDKIGFQLSESHNMPIFSQENPSLFWQSADAFERSNGRVCNEVKIALPKELSLQQQRDLIFEYAQKMLPKSPYTFAIHNDPQGNNPHCHLIFSERVINARTMKLSPEKFFSRKSKNKQGKETGGAEKDTNFQKKEFLAGEYGLRKTWTRTANEHLEKHGFDARIDDRPAKEQGKVEKGHLPRTEYLRLKSLKQQKAHIDFELNRINQQISIGLTNEYVEQLNTHSKDANLALIKTIRSTQRAERTIAGTKQYIEGTERSSTKAIRTIQTGIDKIERLNLKQNRHLSALYTASTGHTNRASASYTAGTGVYPICEQIRAATHRVTELISNLSNRSTLYKTFTENKKLFLDTVSRNLHRNTKEYGSRPIFLYQYEQKLGSRDFIENRNIDSDIKELIDHLKAVDKCLLDEVFNSNIYDQYTKNGISKALYISDFFNGDSDFSEKSKLSDTPFPHGYYSSIFTAVAYNRDNENLFKMIFENEPKQAIAKIVSFILNKVDKLADHIFRKFVENIPNESPNYYQTIQRNYFRR